MIRLYFIGKKSDLIPLEATYLKRINFQGKCELIPANPCGQKTADLCRELDSQSLEKHLDPQAFNVVLDERGDAVDSLVFTEKLEQKHLDGKKIHFYLGGSHGMNQKFIQKCDWKLSFGKMVWTKDLARLMLLEQIYRASQIRAGKNFHKA